MKTEYLGWLLIDDNGVPAGLPDMGALFYFLDNSKMTSWMRAGEKIVKATIIVEDDSIDLTGTEFKLSQVP